MDTTTELKSYKFYSDLKVFSYPQFISNLTNGANPPLHIRIKPTNICNHNCYYCSYRNPKQSLGKDMVVRDFIPYDKMMETIGDIINMGVRAVTFSGGGEPTCYPYLSKVLERLAKSKVKFAMLTNGALLSGEIAELFSKYGSWVRVSMDGWDIESYEKYRGVDDFQKVLINMRKFDDMQRLNGDKCSLGLNIVVTKENANHLFDMVELIRGWKLILIKNIKVSSCVVNDDVEENIRYHSEINRVVEEQVVKIKSSFDISINFTHHKQICGFKKDYTWCPNIQIQPVIGADMNIYACHDKAYTPEGLLGSFKDMSFKEVWEKADKFRINPSKDCNHHCMAHNKKKLMLEFLDPRHQEFV